jgi:hypothetical protein
MTTTTDLANVPHPAGATHVADWYDVDGPDAARYFTGSEWVVAEPNTKHPDLLVQIDGTQSAMARPCVSSVSWKANMSV